MSIVEEIEQKIDKMKSSGNVYKDKRDSMNNEIKKWIEIRDASNQKVKDLLTEASKHKDKRDSINQDVKGTKEKRIELNKKVAETSKNVSTIKSEQLPKDSTRKLESLRRDIKRLEFKQMTSVLAPDKERALVDQLGKLQAELRAHEKTIEGNETFQGAVKELRDARDSAETTHKKLKDLADTAQVEHEEMMKLYEQADLTRKEADLAQKKFLDAKGAADEEHKKYIALLKQIYILDKIQLSLKGKQKKIKKTHLGAVAKKEAEDIYAKFKSGEKLSTEDIMSLQRAGLI